jgi:ferredoxin-type protein NapG
MGTARWREETCVRTIGENCTICVDQCPMGTAALELNGNRVVVKEEGCTGCGVCQHYCPTTPKSIVVTPRDARGDATSGTVPRSK